MEIIKQEVAFEVIDIFGKKIRTTKAYWKKIEQVKHPEANLTIEKVSQTLKKPDIIYQGNDRQSFVFVKKYKSYKLLVIVKYENSQGFILTSYITTKRKINKKVIWQK